MGPGYRTLGPSIGTPSSSDTQMTDYHPNLDGPAEPVGLAMCKTCGGIGLVPAVEYVEHIPYQAAWPCPDCSTTDIVEKPHG